MTKFLTPEQCNILHHHYLPSECCLCYAKQRIAELEAEVARLTHKEVPHFDDNDDGYKERLANPTNLL